MGVTKLWDTDIPMFFDTDAAVAGVEPDMDTQLQVAMNSWIAKETQPIKDACDALTKAITYYDKAAMEDAKQRAQHRVLAAFGEASETSESPDLSKAKEALLDALEAMQDLLDPEPEVPPTPEPEPAKPWYDEQLLEQARELLQIIDQTDFDAMHNARLALVLQQYVAQCRWLMEQIPISHTMHQVVTQALRRLGAIRGAANVEVFIKGLARHHKADWKYVALKAEESLAKFDSDAEEGPSTLSTPKPKKTNGSKLDRDSQPEQVDFPKLLGAQGKGRKVVLFGGITIPEKVKSIKDRTGLEVEWFEVEEGKRRGSNQGVQRIEKSKVSCVIILEGLMSHGVWRSLADTCDSEGVPYAMGNRGGIGTVLQAMEQIEGKL